MKNTDVKMEKSSGHLNLAQIAFWLNGRKMQFEIPPGITTLELLNDKLSMSGTKSSCNEGDCGACTVIIGQRKNGATSYQTVNSCLYPAFRLHGKHLITVEGISGKDELHPVQTALLDEHGTQCGFCTPGFVMSLLGLFLNNTKPGKADILAALEGNLCRCTGYDSIMKAASLLKKRIKDNAGLLPPALRRVEKQLKENNPPLLYKRVENTEGWETYNCHCPKSLSELWQNLQTCKRTGSYKFIAGGTDLMVLANIQHIHYANLIDLSQVSELDGIAIQNNELHIGGNVTLTELQHNKLLKKHFPLMITAIEQMASAQIRNTATLAGNIANASPVADGATTLLALQAKVVLASSRGDRTVQLSEYYHAYKQTELKPEEVIQKVVMPLPSGDKHWHGFLKSAKRKAVDISGVVSAVLISYKGIKITQAVISFGGVAPYPALALKTMTFLTGKTLSGKLIEQAAQLAQSEFTPISDVRGHKDYRSVLIRNHLIRHLTCFLDAVNTKKGKKI
jgi:xanthine dehydrogenase small subunit